MSEDFRPYACELASFGAIADHKHIKKPTFVLQGNSGSGWVTLAADTYVLRRRSGGVEQRLIDDTSPNPTFVDWQAYTDYQDLGNTAFRATYTIRSSGTDTTYTNEAQTFYDDDEYSPNWDDEISNLPFPDAIAADSGHIANWDIGIVDANTISSDNGKVKINASTPSFALGEAVVSAASGYSSGKGIWMGKYASTDWRFRVGDPTNFGYWTAETGDNLTTEAGELFVQETGEGAFVSWDNTTLSVYGEIVALGGDFRGDVDVTGRLTVGGTIKSDNFVTTVSGWRIRGGGNSEFNDILARGTVYATAGEIANWNIGVVDPYTISADSGKVKLSSQFPSFALGESVSSTRSGYLSGKGIWFGRYGLADWRFRVGDPDDSYIAYDNSNFLLHSIGLEFYNGATQTGDISKTGTAWFGRNSGNTTRAMRWDTTGNAGLGAGVYGDAGDVQLGGDNDHVLWDDDTGGNDTRGTLYIKGNVEITGELRTTVFVRAQIQATSGSIILAQNASILTANVTTAAGQNTLNIKNQNGAAIAAVGDRLRIKSDDGDNWFDVDSIVNSGSGSRDYTGTLLSGSAASFKKGAGVVSYGASGKPWIYMTVDDSTAAPRISLWTHVGTPYTEATNVEQARFGNLSGNWDISTDLLGLAAGQYGVASKTWFSVDDSNGLRMGVNTTIRARLTNAGLLQLGADANSTARTEISAGVIQIIRRNGSAVDNVKFQVDTVGTLTIGEDADTESGTRIAFLNSTYSTWNGQTESVPFAAGDILLGTNSSGKGNLWYDHSVGDLKFRIGTTTKITIDTAGDIAIGNISGRHVYIDSTSVQIRAASGSSNTFVTIDSLGVDVARAFSLSPLNLGAQTNWEVNHQNRSYIRIRNGTAPFTIRSMLNGVRDGHIVILHNDTNHNMTLLNNNGTPTGGYSKIYTLEDGGANLGTSGYGTIWLIWQPANPPTQTVPQWFVISRKA